MQPLDGLAQILLQGLHLLDPTLDALVGSQLHHIQSLLAASQVTSTDQDAIESQVLRLDLLPSTLGHANADESSVDVDHRQVFGESKVLSRVSGIDNQAEGYDMRRGAAQSLSPVAMKPSAPILFASSSLACDREMAHTSVPKALANRTAKCPIPPSPTIPTFLPGPQPFRTRGE